MFGNMCAYRCSFCGLSIEVRSECSVILDEVRTRFRFFPESPVDHTDLTITFRVAADALPPADRIPEDIPVTFRGQLPTGEALSRYDDGRKVYLAFDDDTLAVLDMAKGEAEVATATKQDPSGLARLKTLIALHPLLIESLQQRNCFFSHGGVAAVGDRNILICGGSGSGKTTFLLGLVKAGHRFFSDDLFVLDASERQITVWPLPYEIGLCRDAYRFFPEVADRGRIDERQPDSKRRLWLQDAFPESFDTRQQIVPHVIVFPEVIGRDRTRMERITCADSLRRLLAANHLWGTTGSAEKYFNALSDLADATEPLFLAWGKSPDDLPDLAAALPV